MCSFLKFLWSSLVVSFSSVLFSASFFFLLLSVFLLLHDEDTKVRLPLIDWPTGARNQTLKPGDRSYLYKKPSKFLSFSVNGFTWLLHYSVDACISSGGGWRLEGDFCWIVLPVPPTTWSGGGWVRKYNLQLRLSDRSRDWPDLTRPFECFDWLDY